MSMEESGSKLTNRSEKAREPDARLGAGPEWGDGARLHLEPLRSIHQERQPGVPVVKENRLPATAVQPGQQIERDLFGPAELPTVGEVNDGTDQDEIPFSRWAARAPTQKQ